MNTEQDYGEDFIHGVFCLEYFVVFGECVV